METRAPKTIYHYCGADAFLSIIKGGRLWVSDARKTNDRQELRWFKDLAFEHLDTESKNSEEIKALLVELDLQFTLIHDISDYFVCCFSEERDSVPQWSAYAERGTGYAIGFDVNALRLAIGAPLIDSTYSIAPSETASEDPAPKEWGFGPVFYAEQNASGQQLKHLSMLIDIEPLFGKNAPDVAREYIDRVCAFAKHPDFRTEREWRMVFNATLSARRAKEAGAAPEKKQWRKGVYGLTSYFETPDIRSCVKEVVIGPANIDRAWQEYVGDFLTTFGVEARVGVSNSPYR
ncbi:DUF2971 domain-containing protein [Burkholderia pseudomallei]|uniref:DUF2971 domain-containing protein n=1 Tax=Burkholderia pseudomallei TaxID=28450 RepID=UPI004062A918